MYRYVYLYASECGYAGMYRYIIYNIGMPALCLYVYMYTSERKYLDLYISLFIWVWMYLGLSERIIYMYICMRVSM